VHDILAKSHIVLKNMTQVHVQGGAAADDRLTREVSEMVNAVTPRSPRLRLDTNQTFQRTKHTVNAVAPETIFNQRFLSRLRSTFCVIYSTEKKK
jgi:hypothetical protein